MRGKYSEMKVMGRCKGDFRLEIHNFKVLINVVTKYNNCFLVQQKGVVGQQCCRAICMGLIAEFFFLQTELHCNFYYFQKVV